MYLEIISPEFTLFSGEVTSVAVPGVDGEFEMLNNHASIVSNLKQGSIKLYGNINLDEAQKEVFKKGDRRGYFLDINSGTVEMKTIAAAGSYQPHVPHNGILCPNGAFLGTNTNIMVGANTGLTVYFDGQVAMANTTSQSYSFDQDFSIDEIIADAYERLGLVGTAGHQLKTARRSLNILFQEWGNRGLHYWDCLLYTSPSPRDRG